MWCTEAFPRGAGQRGPCSSGRTAGARFTLLKRPVENKYHSVRKYKHIYFNMNAQMLLTFAYKVVPVAAAVNRRDLSHQLITSRTNGSSFSRGAKVPTYSDFLGFHSCRKDFLLREAFPLSGGSSATGGS